ncbi:DinB family protein, partial [Klebsiella pneumoniae]|uniref:DinB family protein n=1 Tax=Klebsiella pneumoniae TaxID=573 RepID=UPI003013E154
SRSDILKMLGEITQSRQMILERCQQLSEEQLRDPVYAGTWSVLQNLAHLAWAEAWMLAWIQCRPGDLPAEGRPPEPALE